MSQPRLLQIHPKAFHLNHFQLKNQSRCAPAVSSEINNSSNNRYVLGRVWLGITVSAAHWLTPSPMKIQGLCQETVQFPQIHVLLLFPCHPFTPSSLPPVLPFRYSVAAVVLAFLAAVSERAKPIPAQITVIKSLWGWGLRLRPLNTLVVVKRWG